MSLYRSRWVVPGLVGLLLSAGAKLGATAPTSLYPPAILLDMERGDVDTLGRAEGITVLRIDPDDDGAGHAGWPKYLVGRAANGKFVWRFPRRLIFPGTGEHSEAEIRAHYESLDQACLVPERAAVVAIGRRQYGLRARDGSVLWRKAGPRVPVLSLQPHRSGCFALVIPDHHLGDNNPDGPELHSSLAFIQARTGEWRWLRRVPAASRLVFRDGMLFLYKGETLVEQFQPASLLDGAK